MVGMLAALAAAACHSTPRAAAVLPTAQAARRDVVARVQATGTVEPINVVEVKSKASGVIRAMPVDVGSVVKAGDLIAQIDPHDVKAEFEQAVADDVVAVGAWQIAQAEAQRADTMYKTQVITAQEHDSVGAALVSAHSAVVGKRASLDLARQALEDATVRAPIGGTILTKPVALGTLITSATGVYGGGTDLVTMADLERVRMRVSIDEQDVGNVRPGEHATIVVDAFPNRSFDGVVEKLEPQAVVDQDVTFFPVLVSIDNHEHLLMPGMNGEVDIVAARRSNVVAVPMDAVRSSSELSAIARMFDVRADSLRELIDPALLPSASAEGDQGGARFAVVALPNGTYEVRAVRLGASDLQWAEVRSGVREGEQVVLLGQASTQRPAVPPSLHLASDIMRPATARPAVAEGAGPR